MGRFDGPELIMERDGVGLASQPLYRWPDPAEVVEAVERLAPCAAEGEWTWRVRPPRVP